MPKRAPNSASQPKEVPVSVSLVQCFQFNTPNGLQITWSVGRAQFVADAFPDRVQILSLDMIRQALVTNTDCGVDPEWAMTRDLSKPVLAVTLEDHKHVIIDGWHRIYKAHKQNVELTVFILTHAEEIPCRLQTVQLPIHEKSR